MAVKQETIDKYLGKVFPSNNYGDVEVIEVLEGSKLKVKFLNTGNIRIYDKVSVTRKEMRDVEAFPVYTTGIQDIKGYLVKGQPHPKDYSVWNNIRQRCYNLNTQDKLYPQYAGCTMSDDFLVFSKFKEWYNNQIGCDQDGWHIDKDLLVKRNKVYSAETCVLLPQQINTLITGANAIRGDLPKGVYYDKSKGINSRYRARVSQDGKYVCYGSYSNLDDAWLAYKEAKEAWVKVVAERWKDKIDPRAYNALLNYTVEWDD